MTTPSATRRTARSLPATRCRRSWSRPRQGPCDGRRHDGPRHPRDAGGELRAHRQPRLGGRQQPAGRRDGQGHRGAAGRSAEEIRHRGGARRRTHPVLPEHGGRSGVSVALRRAQGRPRPAGRMGGGAAEVGVRLEPGAVRCHRSGKDRPPARAVRALPRAVRGRPAAVRRQALARRCGRAFARRDDGQGHRHPAEERQGLLPDGRGRSHRSRASRGQCLPRA